MDQYVRASFYCKFGKYDLTWRLLTFPLSVCWRHLRWPFTTDWYIAKENPAEEDEVAIARMREHLTEHPDDVLERFTFGNMLRREGQIVAAREQYQQVALAENEHRSQEAKKVLATLVEVPDYERRRSVHIVYRKCAGRPRR